ITRWNDPVLAKDNPGVALPELGITVVHRSDGSGTTAIFTDYLAKVSAEWKAKVSSGTSVKWPLGLGGKGNDGVTGQVKQMPGAVGYVELAYARHNQLPAAALQNQDGEFVKPTVQATRAAASEASLPEDFRVSLTNPKGKDAYPMAAFTYLLVQRDQKNTAKGEALIRFLDWAIHDGQKLAPALDYTPLPPSVVSSVEAKLRTFTVAGKPVNLASND
ncbi:MAG: phosphate ABC transporter substrate-binding protein PstS, partial [Myxococcaceae bacterium]